MLRTIALVEELPLRQHSRNVYSNKQVVILLQEISHVDESSPERIQLFRFTNHTECVCKPIADFQE